MNRTKYPRTYHLPWSEGATDDDKTLEDTSIFEGKVVVVTRKLDGENTTIYPDGYVHARSINSSTHPSRDWVRALAGSIASDMPAGFRICGENLFARHSIPYTDLTSYFYVFGIYENDICLSWDETVAYAEMLGLEVVPTIYRGVWDKSRVLSAWENRTRIFGGVDEGYVVRVVDSFPYSNFSRSVAKWVRRNHVTTDSHWIHSKVIPNNLKP